uniref:Putative secreted protein n=1 Tax=Lutzomyia longipalpis TaxID=7200 RepID=A0A7G3APY2_LUTLO
MHCETMLFLCLLLCSETRDSVFFLIKIFHLKLMSFATYKNSFLHEKNFFSNLLGKKNSQTWRKFSMENVEIACFGI